MERPRTALNVQGTLKNDILCVGAGFRQEYRRAAGLCIVQILRIMLRSVHFTAEDGWEAVGCTKGSRVKGEF